LLIRTGLRIDRELAESLMRALIRESSQLNGQKHGQAVRDLDNFRQIITGPGVMVFFNAPWTPIFILVLYYLHPVLGLIAIAGAILLLILGGWNELAIRRPMQAAADAARSNYAQTDDVVRNAEIALGLGMESSLLRRWIQVRRRFLASQALASGRASGFNSIIKFVRYALQGLVVAASVWLILDHQMSPGAIFPAMILLGRALAPVEQAVGSWKALVAARQSFNVIARLLQREYPSPTTMEADLVKGNVEVDRLSVAISGRDRPILRSVSFSLAAGEALGVVGSNGSGKSSLARALVGVWKPTSGSVRIDGADVCHVNRSDISRFIGYLPQDVQLLAGSVKDNIGHFREDSAEQVTVAARLANVHELILHLPNGYDTEVGEGGAALSAGMRQRIALARAVFADPAVLVLDEPNSNLDADAEAALLRTLQELRTRGRTIILIAHRPSMMSVVDRMLVLNDGLVEAFGPRVEVLPRITKLAPVRVAQATGETAQ
jgi:PrtD family type I secretion system ABC transporter